VTSHEDKLKFYRNTRYAAVDFLQHTGELLLIPQTVIATSIIFYHRFYKFIRDEQIPDDKYDKYQIACSCVFIACKCQETLRSLRDICNVLQRIRYPQKPNFSLNCPELAKLKQSISMHEQIVLRALAYNVRISVPYSYVGPYLKCLNFGDPEGVKMEDPVRDLQLQRLLQCTCSLLNDSLRTDLCITHKSHEIAVGCIYLAARLCDVQLPYQRQHKEVNSGEGVSLGDSALSVASASAVAEREWYHLFNVSKETLRSISNEIIQMYSDYKQVEK